VETRAHNIARHLAKDESLDFIFAETIWPTSEYIGESPDITYNPLQIIVHPYKIHRKSFWERIFIKRAKRYIQKNISQFDVIEGQGINSIPGIESNKPTVATIHGTNPWTGNKSPLHEKTLREADKLVPVTNETEKALINEGIDDDRIQTIPNGVDFQGITQHSNADFDQLWKKYGIKDSKTILSVSSFHDKKNIGMLIDSFDTFRNEYPNAQLLLIGDGPNKRKYIDYCENNNIESIKFLGKVPESDLYQLYNSCDLFVLPSKSESWGIVFLEAMAGKCPTIMTSGCGIREIVENRRHTIIVDPNDRTSLVESMIELFDNTKLREKIIVNGFDIANDYRWAKQAQKMKHLMDGLV